MVGIIGLLFYCLVMALGAVALYWVIRLGVKHGLRSYYAETERDSGASVDPLNGLPRP